MVRASPLVVLLLLGAGCVGASAPVSTAAPQAGFLSAAPTGTAAAPTPEPGNETQATGSISGIVTDDEVRPLEGATVELVALGLVVRTGPDARYEFRNVPVGTHEVFASLTGYTSKGHRIVVQSDLVAELDFGLTALLLVQPYHLTLPHASFHQAGISTADAYADLLGVPSCQACVWSFGFAEPPRQVLIEVVGTHTVADPRGPAKTAIYVEDNKTHAAILLTNYYAMPTRVLILEGIANKTLDYKIWVTCDGTWVCVQEKRDTFITGFFHQLAPEGAFAIPKP